MRTAPIPKNRRARNHTSRTFATQLSNGLAVRVFSQPHLRRAYLSIFVRSGSRYENERTSGLSHFVEHMLFRGTRSRPRAFDVNRALELVGAQVNAATHPDYLVLEASAPRECAAATLEILAEMIREPLFADIEKEKAVVREEILETADVRGKSLDPDDLSRVVLFGDHPLGYRVTGRLPSIMAFTTGDLRAHMRKHYVASNMAVVATGAVEPREIVALLQRTLASVPRGKRVAARAPAPFDGPRGRFLPRGGPQADVRLSFRAVGELDPGRPALDLMMQAIDDGLGARVQQRLVNELGLAYEAFGGTDLYEDCGVIDFGAAGANHKIGKLVAAMVDLVRDIRDVGLREDEIELARRRFLWEQEGMEDDPRGTGSLIGTWALFGRAMDPATLAREVAETSIDEVHAIARRVFRAKNAVLAVVGDVKREQAIRTMQCVTDLA